MRVLLLISLSLISISAALVAGCGEVDQTKTAGNTSRGDVPAYQGAKDPFVVKGWTPGDKTAWENQIRSRSQTQNEYVRVN